MHTVVVWQRDWKQEPTAKFDISQYSPVALVEVPDGRNPLDFAYEATNTIDKYWWENKSVTKMFTGEGCRSTSMFDFMVFEDKFYQVDSFGFKQIEKPQ